uniref:Nanos-type domain-containing protein n=1 Tax=Caenorhabditis tropicalis TaxID=1561998 RepID=A0A1I7TVD8_9PELO
MSLETPSNTNSSFNSDDLDEVVLHYPDDEIFRPRTPLPTFDFVVGNRVNTSLYAQEMSLLTFTPPPDSTERPETSTSSIFSFITDTIRTPPPPESLRLPTFEVPSDTIFSDASNFATIGVFAELNKWLNECQPLGNFASVSAEETAKDTKDNSFVHSLPSLFKKRENGCGYCRSVGYPRWQTHTRQKCEQLIALAPCKVCGAHGEKNHTETYCPMKPSVILTLNESFTQSLEDGRFRRNCNLFHKYSELIHSIYSPSD